ncbi:Rho GTPase-activating protein 6 [Balamuthia mandrillaris]
MEAAQAWNKKWEQFLQRTLQLQQQLKSEQQELLKHASGSEASSVLDSALLSAFTGALRSCEQEQTALTAGLQKLLEASRSPKLPSALKQDSNTSLQNYLQLIHLHHSNLSQSISSSFHSSPRKLPPGRPLRADSPQRVVPPLDLKDQQQQQPNEDPTATTNGSDGGAGRGINLARRGSKSSFHPRGGGVVRGGATGGSMRGGGLVSPGRVPPKGPLPALPKSPSLDSLHSVASSSSSPTSQQQQQQANTSATPSATEAMIINAQQHQQSATARPKSGSRTALSGGGGEVIGRGTVLMRNPGLAEQLYRIGVISPSEAEASSSSSTTSSASGSSSASSSSSSSSSKSKISFWGKSPRPSSSSLSSSNGAEPKGPTMGAGRRSTFSGLETPQALLRDFIIAERHYLYYNLTPLKECLEALNGDAQAKLSPEDESIIFYEIQRIHAFHATLTSNLQTALKKWPNMLIGAIFLKKYPEFLSIYPSLITQMSLALDRFETLKTTSRSFYTVVKNFERERNVDVSTLLVMPVKRSSSYVPFLNNLLRRIPETDVDYPNLQKAVQLYTTFAAQIQTAMRGSLRIEEQIAIKKLITFDDPRQEFQCEASRTFVKEGQLTHQLNQEKKKNLYNCFLFSDCLLLTADVQTSLLAPSGGSLGRLPALHTMTRYAYAGSASSPYKFVSCIELRRVVLHADGTLKTATHNSSVFSVEVPAERTTHHFVCASPQEKEEWLHALERAFAEVKQKQIFGVSLAELAEREQAKTGFDLPWIIEETANYILTNSLNKEGLFRLSASISELEGLKDKLQSGQRIKLTPESYDDHIVASLMKLWLRELSEPLLTWDLYDDWVKVDALPTETAKTQRIKELLLQLPQTNRFCLSLLCKCLHAVSQNSAVNRMTAKNLAIVVGPNILGKKDGSIVSADASAINELCELFIANYSALFKDIEAERLERQKLHKEKQDEAEKQKQQEEKELTSIELLRPENLREEEKQEVILPEGDVVKEGFLVKKGATIRNWKKRWFVLKYQSFAYYKSAEDKTPAGVIDLKDCCVESSNEKPNSFCVNTAGRSYVIQCSTAQEQHEWMHAVNSCIENIIVRRSEDIESGSFEGISSWFNY